MVSDVPGSARVAVIGGGVAGLVAARDLARAGTRVVLLEANDRLGGRLKSETIDGVRLDVGAEAFAVRGGAVAELLGELGLEGRIVSPAALGAWLVSDRGASPMPASGMIGIPVRPLGRRTIAAVGVSGAVRAAVEPLLPRRVGAGSASLAALIRARLGRRVLERLVGPVAQGVYSADPADLPVPTELAVALERRGSLIAAARTVRGTAIQAGGAVAGLRNGMGELVDALDREIRALGVEVRTGTRVGGAAAHGRRWKVQMSEAAVIVDAVLFASADAYDACTSAACTSAASTGAAPCDAHPRTTVEVVTLLVEDTRLDRAPRGTGALVATSGVGRANRDEAPRAKALTHVSAKWPQRFAGLQPGAHALRLSYGSASAAPATLKLSDDEARAQAVADASLILGLELSPNSVRGMRRTRWDFASHRIGAPSGELPPHWEIAGDWVSGTGLASVVPGASAAAARILEGLEHADTRLDIHLEHSR